MGSSRRCRHVVVQRELEFLPVWVMYFRETVSRSFHNQRLAAAPRGIYRFCANPERGERETGEAASHRPPFGLGPWIGARVGSHRCPILRPGRRLLYEQALHQATAFSPAIWRAIRRRSRAASSLRSRSAKISASRLSSLSLGVT